MKNKIYTNKYNYRDALIVAFTNCATSVFAAVIIFAIMGFKVSNSAVMKINLFNTICLLNPCRHTMPTKLA